MKIKSNCKIYILKCKYCQKEYIEVLNNFQFSTQCPYCNISYSPYNKILELELMSEVRFQRFIEKFLKDQYPNSADIFLRINSLQTQFISFIKEIDYILECIKDINQNELECRIEFEEYCMGFEASVGYGIYCLSQRNCDTITQYLDGYMSEYRKGYSRKEFPFYTFCEVETS